MINPPSSNFSIVQNISAIIFSESVKKYAKITLVVFTIFAAAGALFVFYQRRHKINPINNDQNQALPPNISPIKANQNVAKPEKKNQNQSPVKSDEEIAKELKAEEDIKNPTPQSPVKSDEEIAKELQEEENRKNEIPQSPVKSDEEIAKELQAKYDVEKDISPITPEDKKNEVEIDSPAEGEEIKIDSPEKKPLAPRITPFDSVEKICNEIFENALDPSFSAVKAFSHLDPQIKKEVSNLLNEIITEFEKRHPFLPKVKHGGPVPHYYAQVKNESDEHRTYYTLLGIFNLLEKGPPIFDDLKRKQFIGGEDNYGPHEGVQEFKNCTGSHVDLDTEKKAPNDNAAIEEAQLLITEFGKLLGCKNLNPEQIAQSFPHRNLHLPKFGQPVHLAQDHQDRSKHGIWKRVSPVDPSKMNYYINVPNLSIVTPAVLKMPYLVAELAYRTKEKNKGVLPKAFFDAFFKDALSDKCFNDKIDRLTIFYHDWTAKLEGALSPEEEARKKIVQGAFGDPIGQQDPDVVLKEAFTAQSLIGFLDEFNFECKKNTSFEDWVKTENLNIQRALIKKGCWERRLYRNCEGEDYFLLNTSTLRIFLKAYYEYLKMM